MDTRKSESFLRFDNPVLVSSIFMINRDYKDFKNVGLLPFLVKTQALEPREKTQDTMQSKVLVAVMTSETLNLDEKTPCYISVSMEANFEWKKGTISDDRAKGMLKVNAASLLFSYIRPHITMLTENSDIPTQRIPFIDFTKSRNES